MPEDYAGTYVSVSEAIGMLGCTSPTFYRWKRLHADFPQPNERNRYLDLDVLEYAARHAIRAKTLR